MNYLVALYGSQYYELTNNGKSGDSGRLNGNIFLSAFIILALLLIIVFLATFSEGFSHSLNNLFHSLFGYSSGKTIGRLLAIPLMGLIYFSISQTIGSTANYQKMVDEFNNFPEEDKKKSTIKILKPFFIVLGAFFILMMSSLFR